MPRRLYVVLSASLRVHGGIPRFNRALCGALEEIAPELDLAATVFVPAGGAPEDARAWRHLRFREFSSHAGLAGRLLAAVIAERPVGLLVGHLGMSPAALPCAPFLKRGYGIIVHGVEGWTVPRLSRRIAVRHASVALSVSRYTGDAVCRATGLDAGRVRILPNAVDDRLAEEGTADGAEPDQVEMLTVSRLVREETYKGIDHTLRALAGLRDRCPRLRHRIVGAGSDKERLIEIVRSLRIEDRVTFEEGLDDRALARRYRGCAMFVLPSGGEGFGIVFIEAMRFSKACIGGAEGGTPEVIEEGVTGLVVPHGNQQRLEGAIATLYGSPDLRRRMGEAGRRRVEERFSLSAYRERLRGHLEEWLVRGR